MLWWFLVVPDYVELCCDGAVKHSVSVDMRLYVFVVIAASVSDSDEGEAELGECDLSGTDSCVVLALVVAWIRQMPNR